LGFFGSGAKSNFGFPIIGVDETNNSVIITNIINDIKENKNNICYLCYTLLYYLASKYEKYFKEISFSYIIDDTLIGSIKSIAKQLKLDLIEL
jgi:hypothetical protein